ncbi:LEAF RUST 10 DISEASE-RESISTANCE LOCUS RECEPTOR-LIKE PROTEIN KINASE-like 2.2 isoform X2 [Populus nigra]|uniref:LEAF RUST 10 DISEASE-RESISTANCE LOCUS RECEPTOR-LIKE PROTEIN KINASE-like 2.2 isoform X2 n=1 Tax=Populus nigra TaxID=3691 RepID=UPI002B2788A4|nr:LEAF RUST 10 DISEASE-RESISTANCE LOCUS RECEPTOR-LIKE PROTEIN KINASE-like 2.2 isoform X2 [Populus nigra]
MLSGISKHHFGAYPALLFLVILAGHQSCSARKNSTVDCAPSCGNIHISYPFRLSTDPNSCGNKKYELTCENNRPALYLKGVRYYVQAINYYSEFTIQLVDADVQKHGCFSIPRHSFMMRYLNGDNIDHYYPYGVTVYGSSFTLVFISCQNPIPSPRFNSVNTSSCKNGSISSPTFRHVEGYSYVMVAEHIYVADVPDVCRINFIYEATSSITEQKNITNMSLIDVQDILAYGFELSWEQDACGYIKENGSILDDAIMRAYCGDPRRIGSPIKVAIDFLANRILAYVAIWPLSRYLQDSFWIEYNSFGVSTTKTISSDFLSTLIVLLLTLLVLLVPIGIYHILLFICGFPCLITLLVYTWRRRHLSMYGNIEEFLQSHDHNLTLIRYSYSEIKKITHGFNNMLGKGGYGSVYKGKLRSGRLAAVKILCKGIANEQEFINEVATIGRIHHCNVVQLIGFTVEGSKRALIYEFMPNGSLEKYIFSKQGCIPLSNQKIYEISLGVARGIEYLHQGCDMQILHFDIKPHNILLDENFTPKVSDFGLAKLYPTNNSVVSFTKARGTYGYMAPELNFRSIGGVSYKADVYSFGMLLMDMVGRRKYMNALKDHSSQMYFPSWIYDQVNEGRDILEDQATEQEKNTIKKITIVALWCIQLKPIDRPSMHKVIQMLEADIESLQMPPKPFLVPQQTSNDDRINMANPTSLRDASNVCSIDSSYQFGR